MSLSHAGHPTTLYSKTKHYGSSYCCDFCRTLERNVWKAILASGNLHKTDVLESNQATSEMLYYYNVTDNKLKSGQM